LVFGVWCAVCVGWALLGPRLLMLAARCSWLQIADWLQCSYDSTQWLTAWFHYSTTPLTTHVYYPISTRHQSTRASSQILR
jgi:hypothetical protein